MRQKPNVLVPGYMPEEGVELLRQHFNLTYYPVERPFSKKELIEKAAHKDGMVIYMTDQIDREVIEGCPDVKVISSFGKGYDNIDIEACRERGIRVTINPCSLTEDTADLAVGLALCCCRNILVSDQGVRAGMVRGWHPTRHLGRRFSGAKAGIVGFGQIGQAIALRLRGFGMETGYYDSKDPAVGDGLEDVRCFHSICQLLEESDFIFLAANLECDSRHLIDAQALAGVKRGAVLINVSRGSVVDEAAVAEALEDERLSGYASDVFAFEDKLDLQAPDYIPEKFIENRKKTVLTGHIGTGTKETRRELALSTARQMIAVFETGTSDGLVTG